MGWLDANEYFLMQTAARDRLDDVRLAADLAAVADDDRDGPSAAATETDRGCAPRAVDSCRFRRQRPALSSPVA